MKSILASGGNRGIDLQTARELVAQGHRVVVLGRDQHEGEEALAPLPQTCLVLCHITKASQEITGA